VLFPEHAAKEISMAFEIGKVRTFVTDLLKKNKALTEREVKAAIGKAFKVNPRDVGAGVIREVREALGIDRPGAIAFAKKMLTQDPTLEAKKVIGAIGSKFGIRLGAPDVSRLRPKKMGKGGPRRRARKDVAAAPVKRGPGRPRKVAAAAAVTVVKKSAKGGPGRPAAGGRISVSYQGTGSPESLAAFFRSLAG
jgi:hypothetical protein